MSRSKIFNMLKNRGTQENGRNAFDLSGFESYTEKAQTINIIRCIDTLPDDYIKLKISDFTQCAQPMKTAAFVRGTREICAYYVPYNSIWHNFNQYQATREDPDSALLKAQGISYEPRLSLASMYIMAGAMFFEYLYAHYIYPVSELLEDITINEHTPAQTEQLTILFSFSPGFIAKEKECLNVDLAGAGSRFFAWIGAANFTSTNGPACLPFYYNVRENAVDNPLKRSDYCQDTVGNYCWADVVRKFDMLGYGNIYPLFDHMLRIWNGDNQGSWNWFLEEIGTWDNNDDAQSSLASLSQLATTLAKNFMFQVKTIVNSDPSITISAYTDQFADVFVNAYPMFAYNRCFYDMFRNSYYDLNYDVRNYNCDFADCSSAIASVLRPSMLPLRFWKLESHQYKKDMFTGVLPDTQYGAVSSIDLSGINILNDRISSGGYGAGVTDGSLVVKTDVSVVDSNGITRTVPNTSIDFSNSSSWSIPNAFDMFALKRAECLQQYRMDLLRAGNKTRDIFKQIYGTNPKSELDEAPYFVDVLGQSLNIDPIIATSNTEQGDNGSLGDIAARVTSRQDGTIKFSTQDFGCLLLLDYTLIDASYNSTMIDPTRFELTQESHFIPQLQNLGFEALFGDSLNIFGTVAERQRTLGYTLPYVHKKTYVDKCHGNMVSVNFPSKIGFADSGAIILPSSVSVPYVGSRSVWTVTRKDMQNAHTVQLRFFYGNPNILDDVMVLAVDPTFDTDHFICHTMVEVDSVRQLSELGLPRFC